MRYAIGIIIGLILGIAGIAYASTTQADIEGAGKDGWIEIGDPNQSNLDGRMGTQKVKRFYDKDTNTVCWVYNGVYSGFGGVGGISCVNK